MNKKLFWLLLLTIFLSFMASCSAINQIDPNVFALLEEPTQTATILPATATTIPTKTPEPIPTPLPEVRIEDADEFLLAGNYEAAASEYRSAMEGHADKKSKLYGAFGLAQIAYHEENYPYCISILDTQLEENGDITESAPLWYQLAACFDKNEQYEEEIDALKQYLATSPNSSLKADLQERLGDLYVKISEPETARDHYMSAAVSTSASTSTDIWMKIGDCFLAEGDHSNAIKTWLNTATDATEEYQKARINYSLGSVYLQLEEYEQAYSRFQENVTHYPRQYDSFSSLLALIDAGQTVDEFQRGLINFYVGQYSLAANAFYRYIKTEPDHDGSSWYYIGVSQMYIAEYDLAIEAFQTLIDKYPDNRFYVSAWDEIAFIQWTYLEKHQQAANTLLQYVKLHPDQPDAAAFIYEAGAILERGRRLSEAASTWSRLIDEYPLYQNSDEALFKAAISYFRIKNYEPAIAALNRLALLSSIPNDMARAHMWIGKCYEARGDNEAANSWYQQAAAEAPTDYYGERAKELLDGSSPMVFSDYKDLSNNLQQERDIASQWMRMTFNLSDDNNLDSPDELLLNQTYQKANELWKIGEYQKALDSFEELRITLESDPVNSFRLLNRLVTLGAYRVAVFTSRQILTQAGLIEDIRTLNAPNYFNHIRFGTWFLPYVQEAYDMYGIHPFILYALMRQESMFDPWIYSNAGALGLMQIMPATGKEIAEYIHYPIGYTQDDLLRAEISIRFSGSYLSRQYRYFDGNPFYMLASYNAGAGNTAKWVELDNNDSDLFVEIIRFEETKRYILNVYEFAKFYERLYGI